MQEQRLSMASARLMGQPMFQILSKIKEMERQGHDVIHFEIGDPGFIQKASSLPVMNRHPFFITADTGLGRELMVINCYMFTGFGILENRKCRHAEPP